jgi:hypothetical protein
MVMPSLAETAMNSTGGLKRCLLQAESFLPFSAKEKIVDFYDASVLLVMNFSISLRCSGAMTVKRMPYRCLPSAMFSTLIFCDVHKKVKFSCDPFTFARKKTR